jgi:hypothetical protein
MAESSYSGVALVVAVCLNKESAPEDIDIVWENIVGTRPDDATPSSLIKQVEMVIDRLIDEGEIQS